MKNLVEMLQKFTKIQMTDTEKESTWDAISERIAHQTQPIHSTKAPLEAQRHSSV